MKEKSRNIVFLLSFLMFSPMCGAEVLPEAMAKAVLADRSQGDFGIFNFIEDNWQDLEKVIFYFAPKGPGDFGARSNALNYLAILCRRGTVPQENFFDVGCRAIKHCMFLPSDALNFKTELGTYRRIIGGFGFFAGWAQLPLLKNLKAFFVFLQAMKKHGLLLNVKSFNSINKRLREVQILIEEKPLGGKAKTLGILKNLKSEISSYSKETIDTNAKGVTLQYIDGLITQTKALKLE